MEPDLWRQATPTPVCPKLERLLWLMSPLKIGGGLAYLPKSCLQVLGPQATCVGEPGAVCVRGAAHLGYPCGALVPHGASFARWKGKEWLIDSLSKAEVLGPFRPGLQSLLPEVLGERQVRFQLASQLISPSPGSQSLPLELCAPPHQLT